MSGNLTRRRCIIRGERGRLNKRYNTMYVYVCRVACNSITNGVYMLANCSESYIVAIIWPFMAPSVYVGQHILY